MIWVSKKKVFLVPNFQSRSVPASGHNRLLPYYYPFNRIKPCGTLFRRNCRTSFYRLASFIVAGTLSLNCSSPSPTVNLVKSEFFSHHFICICIYSLWRRVVYRTIWIRRYIRWISCICYICYSVVCLPAHRTFRSACSISLSERTHCQYLRQHGTTKGTGKRQDYATLYGDYSILRA